MFFSIDRKTQGITRTASVFSSLLISTALFCYAGPASAQLVDYGSLQSLFGEPVTTSATGLPQRASDVPVDMTIITADDIRHSGTRSIPQIIGLYVPGADVLRGAQNSYDVGMRGYQQPFQSNLLVLVDGRQVFVDDYSRTIWDNLPVNVDDIRQIEVIKGATSAFSSLFGSNAGDGVINIITYSPIYDKSNVANFTVGTQESMSGDATGTVKGENWGSKFTVGGMNAKEFNTAQGYPLDAPNTRPMHSYVANSTVIQLSPTFQVNTDINYSESRTNVADSVDSYVIGNQKTTSYSGRAGFNWQSPIGVISNNNYFNSNEALLSEPSGDGFGYDQETELFVSQLQDQFTVGSQHTFRIGLEYRYQNFIYGYANELDPMSPDLKENNYSVNGLWLWQITDKLSLTNAIRFDSQRMYEAGTLWPQEVIPASEYSQFNNVWSGNSGIVYHVTDQDTIGANYGRGVLLPSMISLGGNIIQVFGGVGNTVDGEGNPRLKPTLVENYELDYTHKMPELHSSVKISPYYTFTKDIVSAYANTNFDTFTDPNGNVIGPSVSANVGNSSAYGAEIELKGANAGFRWATSYSLSHVKDQDTLYQNLIDYQDSAPESHVRVLFGYTKGPWEFDGNGQWLSSTSMLRDVNTDLPIPVHIDDYYSFGGRIAYSITDRLTVALTGTNLSQAYTSESPWPVVERQVFLGVTGKF